MKLRSIRRTAVGLLALSSALLAVAVVRGDDSGVADTAEPRQARYLVATLLDPERIAVVDLDTGKRVERRVPSGTLCYSEVLAIGRRVVYLAPGAQGARAVSLPLSLKGPPRSLGQADAVVASSTPGRVWLGARDLKRGGLHGLHEVTLDGRVTARVRHPTPGSTLLGATTDGLVFQRDHRIAVWDPTTGRTVHTSPGVFEIAIGRRQIASCNGGCSTLFVGDGRRSHVVHMPPRSNVVVGTGAFAPGGELAAAAVSAPANRPKLALLDVARGESSVVPGVRLGIRGAFAWAPSGRQLYYSGPDGRVFSVQPGTSSGPQPLPLRFHETVLQLLAVG